MTETPPTHPPPEASELDDVLSEARISSLKQSAEWDSEHLIKETLAVRRAQTTLALIRSHAEMAAEVERQRAIADRWRKEHLDIEMRLMAMHNEMQDGSCVELKCLPNYAASVMRLQKADLTAARNRVAELEKKVEAHEKELSAAAVILHSEGYGHADWITAYLNGWSKEEWARGSRDAKAEGGKADD